MKYRLYFYSVFVVRTENGIMKWTEEQTINFVVEYIKYGCLYDKNCAEYRNKQLRKAALLKISKTLNVIDFGPKETYLKIRSLKSTYSQELKKIKSSQRSGAGTSKIYTPQVKWFKILHDALTAVNSSECRETSSFEMVFFPEVEQIENDLEYDNVTRSDEENAAGYEAALQTNNNNNPIIHNHTNITKKTRKRILKDYDNLLTNVQNVANAVNKPIEQSENEFDIFGKSVAAQLKNMPLDMAIEAQMFMQNYLSEKRLRTIQRTMYNSQCSTSSHSSYNMAQPLSSPQTTPTSTPTPPIHPDEYNSQWSSSSHSNYTAQPPPSPQTSSTPAPTLPIYHSEASTEITSNTTATLDLLSEARKPVNNKN